VEEVAVSNENKSLNSDSEEIHEPSWDEPVHEAETGGPSDANHDLEAANHEINSEPPLLDENPDSEIEESEADASLTGEAEIQIKSDSLLPETDIQAIPHEDEGLGEEAQFPEALVEESDSSESDLENLNKQQEIQDLFDENPKGSFQDAPVSPQENDAEEQLKANISIAAIQEENIDSVLEISDELPENLSIELDSEEDLADDVAVPNILDEEIEGNSPPVSLEGNIVSEEHQLLHEQLDIIEKYYANATPDAVQQLHNAIHFGDPQNLMGDITTIFALLNKHHQRINSRMHPQVVHSFNIIHQHVQSLSL
jgi:hypothetical protein